MDLLVRIEELEKTIVEQDRIIEAQANALEAKDGIIAFQARKISELEAKPAQYENPHTPSSAKRFKEPEVLLRKMK